MAAIWVLSCCNGESPFSVTKAPEGLTDIFPGVTGFHSLDNKPGDLVLKRVSIYLRKFRSFCPQGKDEQLAQLYPVNSEFHNFQFPFLVYKSLVHRAHLALNTHILIGELEHGD